MSRAVRQHSLRPIGSRTQRAARRGLRARAGPQAMRCSGRLPLTSLPLPLPPPPSSSSSSSAPSLPLLPASSSSSSSSPSLPLLITSASSSAASSSPSCRPSSAGVKKPCCTGMAARRCLAVAAAASAAMARAAAAAFSGSPSTAALASSSVTASAGCGTPSPPSAPPSPAAAGASSVWSGGSVKKGILPRCQSYSTMRAAVLRSGSPPLDSLPARGRGPGPGLKEGPVERGDRPPGNLRAEHRGTAPQPDSSAMRPQAAVRCRLPAPMPAAHSAASHGTARGAGCARPTTARAPSHPPVLRATWPRKSSASCQALTL